MAKTTPDNKDKEKFKGISPKKIIYPIIIGLGVVGYLFWNEFNIDALKTLNYGIQTIFWLIVAFIFMGFRDFGYMIRLRVLTEKKFNWRQCFRVIMLWEFTSAVTPSAIGGTSIAILYVNKEGMSLGQSSAVVMATSFLDELYFILMFPLLILLVDSQLLFLTVEKGFSFRNEFLLFATIGYSLKLLYTIALSYGLFYNPRGLKWLILQIFRLPIIRRWRYDAKNAGTEIVESSKELVKKPFRFWLKAFGATFFSWTSRYWVVNVLLLAFFAVNDHFLIFARQLVMWIMMLVSPTPGGSGFAEYIFTRYLSDFIPVETALVGSIIIALALLWRLISYYPYLIIGAIILPKWINDKFRKTEPEEIGQPID
ncbi:MAG: lysylphosphatidylglycerol synthase transmembrane domain-containing protein [Salinivirgaceae bacterium]|nr:lysylphosphatidylglycerol synthase transmembrane domain-containing protein [Salinivirgaceae bacterium]MDD4746460.1 lysylphosphatidylglycerol synthase transmembrane domain-containing protein [Salinivirgaceae bacterium]MDY0281533.1 lysylphosphatidylglycerol synthase transmembrane domain-containing protein [Salinivirgaceae bacterium]